MLIKLKDKAESRSVRFVYAGTGSEARPVLTGIKVDGDKIISADGYVLHISKAPEELKEYDGEILKFESRPNVNPAPVEINKLEGTFPAYEKIIPGGIPEFEIAIDPQKLKELAEMPACEGSEDKANYLLFKFYGQERPFVAENSDKSSMAVIMPRHIER